ncbi:MAG: peptidase M14 [Pseudonocardia sp.]|nr:MAG: peptidase M14 [Pseudonocardia sp.]
MRRARIIGHDREAMINLAGVSGVEVIRQTLRGLHDGRYRVQVLGEPTALGTLESQGFEVAYVEDLPSPVTDEADRTLTRTDDSRKDGGGPRGGPDGYLSVNEADKRLEILINGPSTDVVTAIHLPHKTWEGRVCRAIRIGRDSQTATGICLLGGVHAREWGSTDILIAFAEQLLTGWNHNQGITLGQNQFTSEVVRQLVEETSIFLIPQVNPDGRNYSLTADPNWRKNRRPAPPGSNGAGACVGVDLNRNYDFLWDYATAFAPDAAVACSSQPCHPEVYVGPSAASEPETRNVVHLLDQHPEIAYLVDIHSFGELIMYSWGDDENQSSQPDMAFTNREWDGQRGHFRDEYREFLSDRDRGLLVSLGTEMREGIAAVRGRDYRVQQSANLYPTAGTVDDYSFCRHITNPVNTKILAFTVEWGSEDNPTPFHPPYPEMREIIAELTSGLLTFCDAARRESATQSRQDAR